MPAAEPTLSHRILRHKAPCGRQVSLERRINGSIAGYVMVCRACGNVVLAERDVYPPGPVVLLTLAVLSDAT